MHVLGGEYSTIGAGSLSLLTQIHFQLKHISISSEFSILKHFQLGHISPAHDIIYNFQYTLKHYNTVLV